MAAVKYGIILSAVFLLFTILVMAQCSVAIAEAKAADDLESSNYQYSVAMLVITLLLLVGSAVVLGLYVKEMLAGRKLAGRLPITSSSLAPLPAAATTL